MIQNCFKGRAMSERFRIKTIRMESGERLPLMLRVNGAPDWHTTLYSLTMQRSSHSGIA